jgi:pimeloyl-ACP methyl ester carboxylesterase
MARTQYRINVGDLSVAIDDVGAGPPVVLLHGLGCGKRMWACQTRALRRHFRVISYDLRGHGSPARRPRRPIIPPRI